MLVHPLKLSTYPTTSLRYNRWWSDNFSGNAVEQSLREEQEKGSGAEAERQVQLEERVSGQLPTLLPILSCIRFVFLSPPLGV